MYKSYIYIYIYTSFKYGLVGRVERKEPKRYDFCLVLSYHIALVYK